MAAQPKLDFKMLVLPAMLLFSKKIDFKDPEILKLVQAAFITGPFLCGGAIINNLLIIYLFTVAILMLSLYLYVYTLVTKRADRAKAIWVSKPKQQLPFGLGPPPEQLKPEDFDETTYEKHEKKLLLEAAQAIIMSGAISFFMSIKFNVHMSLLIQAVMMPLNAFDMLVLKKYILGVQKSSDGTNLYNEFLSAPSIKSLEIAEKLKSAGSSMSPGTIFTFINTYINFFRNFLFVKLWRSQPSVTTSRVLWSSQMKTPKQQKLSPHPPRKSTNFMLLLL